MMVVETAIVSLRQRMTILIRNHRHAPVMTIPHGAPAAPA
jgi:hypothetical protein